jgi:hypothetical protein
VTPRRRRISTRPCSADAPSVAEHEARHVLAITTTARRQLTEHLPEAVATGTYEFIVGPLLDNPHRVGKQLARP